MHVVQRAKKQVIIIIVALIFIVDVIKQSTFFLTFGLDKRTEHRVVWSHNIACWIVKKKQCLVDFSLVKFSARIVYKQFIFEFRFTFELLFILLILLQR